VSDGSVRLESQTASCIWIIEEGDEAHGKTTATFLLENISSIISFCFEYEGASRAIAHMDLVNMTPKEAEHWCNNEATIQPSKTQLTNPRQMIQVQANADIILATFII